MHLSLDVKRKLMARSDRVKSVDLHPTEPWTLTALYDGRCHVWNYETNQLMKTFEICELPVRAAKFVVREQWVVTGSDDGLVRVFNYNTHERIHQWEAHGDYIRCILCHPTEPFIFTTSDDTTIKLWNWKDKWQLQQIFEGHTHYVMQMALNPKDHQQFVTASLDKMLKVWQIGTSTPSFTLTGHERGINCVDYCAGDRPYLASGGDDKTVRIWDCQARSCVRVLDGHTQNVSAVIFHRELPILITGSEDATVRVWNLATFRLENTLNYGLERVWAVSARQSTNVIAIGADEGTVVVKLGREEPVVSMDSSGKIVLAKNTRLMQINLKAADPTELVKAQGAQNFFKNNGSDGEKLVLPFKDLGACEFFPKFLKHSTNGRFVAACGYGEYIVYTAMALRHVDFGSAQEFAWSTTEASTFALLDSTTNIKIKKNFKDHSEIRADGAVEGIEGGPLLAARSVSTLAFYDWETGDLVRRLEVVAKGIYWSDSAELVAIAAEDTLFVLKYDADAKNDEEGDEDGIQSAFDVVCTLAESIKSALWIGDCLVFVNKNNRLCYYVGGETVTIAFIDRALYLLGYQVKESRIFAIDKDLNVVSYRLEKSVLEYETAVMRKEFKEANKILENVPMEQRTSVARFLEKQGFKKLALAVSSDMNHLFELALGLGDLQLAKTIAETTESDEKWRALGQAATIRGEIELASECLSKARDFGGLMLLASSAGSSKMMQQVATEATSAKEFNVGFVSHLLLGHVDECLEALISSNRIPEAAFFARTYCPSQVPRVLELWKAKTENNKVILAVGKGM